MRKLRKAGLVLAVIAVAYGALIAACIAVAARNGEILEDLGGED